MTVLRCMLLAAALVWGAQDPIGREFHVASDGSDDGPGSAERPWATVAHAAQVLVAGDRVTVRAGTYARQTIAPKNSGEAGKPILYRGAPGAKVVLDGARLGDDNTREGFRFAGRAFDYVTIENFEIRNYGKPLVFAKDSGPNSHLVLRGLEIHHCERGLLAYGSGHHDWLIQDCRFHHIPETGVDVSGRRLRFERCVSEDNDDHQGQKGDADGFHVENGEEIEFVDCLAQHNSEDGFDLKASAVKLLRCRSVGNGNNYKLWGKDVTLVNCVAWAAQDSNVTCAANDGSVPFTKSLVHCTIGGAPAEAHGGGYGIGFSDGSHRVSLRNCLIAGVGRPFFAWKKNAKLQFDEDYNVFQPTGTDFLVHEGGWKIAAAEFRTSWREKFGSGEHSLLLKSMEEVGFVDAKSGDLRLRPESRCGIGSPQHATPEDAANAPRKGSPPDCGAYGR